MKVCILCERELPARKWWQLPRPPCCPPEDALCKPLFFARMKNQGVAVSDGRCGLTHPHSPYARCSGVSK